MLPDLTLILPELILVCGGMALLMLGVFSGDKSDRFLSWLAVLLFVLAGVATLMSCDMRTTIFNDQFIIDDFADLNTDLRHAAGNRRA